MSVESHRPKTKLRKGSKLATIRASCIDGSPTSSSPSPRRDLNGVDAQRKPRCPKANWKSHRDNRNSDRKPSDKSDSDNVLIVDSKNVRDSTKARFKTGKFNNELLNFSYDVPSSRQTHQHVGYGRSRHYSFSSHSKEVFLQANCRFVVRSNENYSKHMIDPDLLVDWDLIEQVRLSSDEIPNCPICLYVPIVARITKCGHVYCWSCINHYLKLGTKKYRKCPICFDDIQYEDLRSAVSEAKHKFTVGDKITMVLMKREKGSSCAHPVNQPDDMSYAKLIPASNEAILNDIVLPEKTELMKQLESAIIEQNDEICFIENAISALTEKETILRHVLSENVSCLSNFSTSTIDDTDNEIKHDDNQVVDGCDSIVNLVDGRNATDDKQSNYYYFYQAQDGQNLFIHPVNVRCLVREYGSLEQCPEMITASILNIESLSVNEETRKKFRYISHLPKTCEFTICELMLRPPYVSKATLTFFADEFRKRKQQRQQKKREDRRSERRYEATNRFDDYGRETIKAEPYEDIRLTSLTEFPEQLNIPYNGAFGCDSPLSEASDSPLLQSPNYEVSSAMNLTMSFAQTLGKSVGNSKEWKPLMKKKSLAASTDENGWPSHVECNSSDDANYDSDATPVPSYADAFVMALQLPKESRNADVEQPLNLSKKQKKKSKHVLFSTGSTRKY